MKKLIISAFLIVGMVASVNAAEPRRSVRGVASSNATSVQKTAARSAVSARGAAKQPTATVAARSAARPVTARASTTQKVINSGTKVAGATKNTAVNEECQNKYFGCMDAFCMLDNTSGGRCLCSDRNAELDAVLAEIEALDQQSYQMATLGVEQIEMGENADAAIAKANAVAENTTGTRRSSRESLESMWNNTDDFEIEEDIFEETGTMQSVIDGKRGDALHRAASELCLAQVPECSADTSILQMLYAQRIKSDCSAYENSLKQQKNESQSRLSAAQKALREAALEQLKSANKYDLGQCTVQFKQCMQTTAECGNDFSKCAVVNAIDNTNVNKMTSKKAKNYPIKGASTTIEISASTYDALIAKKPICESVTKSCVSVADQVWDTFLREVAPTLKSAELIAEDTARQNCIGNISQCFQKACKDNIDPNDPDGSYDLCLTRPETLLSLCKVPLNACGVDASRADKAEKSQIWEFVLARLASMRVDSCTKEVKSCLQSDDRCGKDYAQCVGLDTDTIIRMCPYDKMVGCQKKYGETDVRGDAVYDELSNLVQGIMMNIDNSMLTMCQNAANEAMIRVCGGTENCDNLAVDTDVGAHSLDYKICEYKSNGGTMDIAYNACRTNVSQILDSELGRVNGSQNGQLGPVTPFAGVIDGTIYWESVEIDDNGRLISADEYLDKIGAKSTISEQQKEKVKSELAVLQQSIDTAIDTIESDPTVQYCMYGREVQGMNKSVLGANGSSSSRTKIGSRSADVARFPELTKQMRSMIAASALRKAKDNYYAKYDELNEQLMQDYAKIGERMALIADENAKDVRREIGRRACLGLADASSLPKSPEPPKSAFGKIVSMVAIAGAAIAIPLTGGISTAVIASGVTATTGVTTTAAIGGGALLTSAIGLGASGSSSGGNGKEVNLSMDLVASKQLNQWNYKEVVTTTYEWDLLNCHKCVRSQECKTTKSPLFGRPYCKKWAEEKETCTDTQF